MGQSKLDKVLISLKELSPTAVDLALGRLHVLLGKLGDPHKKLPPVIHVAGTNGKGSTIAYLRSILEAAGYRCHVYTSPHLLTFNERIRLAGELISDDDLVGYLEEVRAVNDGDNITFFEITTAAALLAFSRVPADVVLLETGMGGMYDATNVVDDPLLTIITTISYDHTDWLGKTLPEIAGQKAGIMKPACPCVIGQQLTWAQDQVMPVFEKQASELKAPLIWNWGVICKGTEMRLGWNGQTFHYPLPNLPGEHQCWNAGAAIIALKNQTRFMVSEEDIVQGLTSAEWPGRLERMTRGPLVNNLPEGWEIWYDGGHNDSSSEVLGRHLQTWKADGERPLHIIAGMVQSRQPKDSIIPLLRFADSVTTFSFVKGPYDVPGPSYPANELAKVLQDHHSSVQAQETLPQAVKAVVTQKEPGRILVTGTLYAYKDMF